MISHLEIEGNGLFETFEKERAERALEEAQLQLEIRTIKIQEALL
jgi:hypothetical protein